MLMDNQAGDLLFVDAAETALSSARALDQNGYKIPLLRQLIKRALTTLTT
jgi:CO/xanthine dehydrogenase FAD-binding subunit